MTLRVRPSAGFLALAALCGTRLLAADGSLCVDIADPAKRLACYDAALMPARGAPAAAMPAAPAEHATSAAQSPTPATLAPSPPAAKDSRLYSMFGLHSKPDKESARLRLTATVVAVQMRPTGEVITLDNDQVWQIAEYRSDPFVEVHDAIVIDPATLGSFLLSHARGGAGVRVKRLR